MRPDPLQRLPGLRQLLTRLRPSPARAAHLRLGLWGERQAERFLRREGLRILGRRVRVGKKDELDLIARDGRVFVVIEVKTRAAEGLEPPRKAVDAEKRYHLSRAAVRYVRRLQPPPDAIRFDIVEVIGQPKGPPPEIRHHANAFPLHHSFRL